MTGGKELESRTCCTKAAVILLLAISSLNRLPAATGLPAKPCTALRGMVPLFHCQSQSLHIRLPEAAILPTSC